MPMTAADYRESLRRHSPRVFVDGQRIESMVDAPQLQPGINAIGVSYDMALREELAPIKQAVQASSGKTVNRMLHVDQSSGDLLNKLEAVRVLCQETGCAQRYLAHDAFSALVATTARIDADKGTRYGERFTAYLHDCQDRDLAVGIAMNDAKGDRSKRPHEQAHVDSYVHIVERNAKGIVISGTKAIVTGAPYVHEFLVMPCRHMAEADAAFAVCCAVPCDADGITIVARPAGRPGEKAALFSNKYGQSTGVVVFDRVFVAWERVFLAGEWEHSSHLTYGYATHRRHTRIAARAGFGDLLIGAGALMCEANGFDPGAETHLREQMVQLIQAARFIEDLTASYQGGWYSAISLHGGGSPAATKQEIWRNYPVGGKVEPAERLLGRGVLADPTRKIAAIRQPGKCCDTGCSPPSRTTMVALPASTKGEPP